MQIQGNQTPYTKSKFTSAVLYTEVVLIAVLLLSHTHLLNSSCLNLISFVLLFLCYFILYPIALIAERNGLSIKDLLLLGLSFIALGLAILYPWIRPLFEMTMHLPYEAVVIYNSIQLLSSIGTILVFLTLFYSLYIWHRIGNKRPAAKRFAFILWPRQMVIIAQIVFIGIPL